MVFLESTSVMELSLALAGVIGSIAACIHGSKCSKVKCSLSGCEIERIPAGSEQTTQADEHRAPQSQSINHTSDTPSTSRTSPDAAASAARSSASGAVPTTSTPDVLTV